jgi:hypothetical protein
MALAFLFRQLRVKRLDTGLRFNLKALIIDHNHRPDSRQEAMTVSTWLEELG